MALDRGFPGLGRFSGGPGSNGCSKEFSENKNYSQKVPFTGILYGDVPKWLKGPDSKSGRSVPPAQEFKSLHLRQEKTG